MGIIASLDTTQVVDPRLSYWEVVLTTGKVLSENNLVFDFRRAGYRQIDWALDLNTSGDILKIRELWLVTPGGHRTTLRGGAERPIMFSIKDAGTAFQFKHAMFDSLGGSGRHVEAQCIGRVTNKETGDCECWIWDRVLGLIEYKSNINNFGSWRSGLMPLTKLSTNVIGLRL